MNFEDYIRNNKLKMGKKESLARQLAGLPESAPQGLYRIPDTYRALA